MRENPTRFVGHIHARESAMVGLDREW